MPRGLLVLPEAQWQRCVDLARRGMRQYVLQFADLADRPSGKAVKVPFGERSLILPASRGPKLVENFFQRSTRPQRALAALLFIRGARKAVEWRKLVEEDPWLREFDDVEADLIVTLLPAPAAPGWEPVGAFVHPQSLSAFSRRLVERLCERGFISSRDQSDARRVVSSLLLSQQRDMAEDLADLVKHGPSLLLHNAGFINFTISQRTRRVRKTTERRDVRV